LEGRPDIAAVAASDASKTRSAKRRTNVVASAHLAKRYRLHKQTQALRLRRSGEGLHAPTEETPPVSQNDDGDDDCPEDALP